MGSQLYIKAPTVLTFPKQYNDHLPPEVTKNDKEEKGSEIMGNNITVPLEMKSDLGMFCLNLRPYRKIELIHAPPAVVDCVRKVANEVNSLSAGNNDNFETPSKDKLGALQFKMSDKLFVNGNGKTAATLGKLFCIRLLEEMHKMGYDLQISSDLARCSVVIWNGPQSTTGTLFFRKVASERPTAKVVCVAPGRTDAIVLMNHSEKVKNAVENAIKDAWPSGILSQGDSKIFFGKSILDVNREDLTYHVHDIQINGSPWFASEDNVDNNRIINMIVRNLSKINLKLIGGINIKGGTDSLFFMDDPGSHAQAQLSSISLCQSNLLRLVDCREESESVRQAITKSGFRIKDESVREHHAKMRLNGSPWRCSGAEGVRSRQLVARISEAMLQRGWALTDAIDISSMDNDKSMLLFRKCVPRTASFSCISLTSAGNLRLIDFSPEDQEVLKTCILENYLPGVSVRDTSGAESNSLKFTLAGEPWCSHAAGLHARSLLFHLFAVAVNLGFQIAASADVSSKHTSQGENLYRDDVPCLLDVHSIFLVKMPPKPAS